MSLEINMKLKKIHYLLTKKETKLPIIIKQVNELMLEGTTSFILSYFIKRKQEQNLIYYSNKNILKSLSEFAELPDELSRTYYNINKPVFFILPNYFILDRLKINRYFHKHFYKSFLLEENTAEIFFMIFNKERIEKSLYTNFYYLTLYFLILSIFIN